MTTKPAKKTSGGKGGAAVSAHEEIPQERKVLLLRTTDKDGKSYGGFQWPESGWVDCPDWNPQARCGGGLHGLPFGEGEWSLLSYDPTALWWVVEADLDTMVRIDKAKVKVPYCKIVYCGDYCGATTMALACKWAIERYVKKEVATSATAGNTSHSAAAGNYSHSATAGYYSHSAAAGNYSHSAAAGNYSHSAAAGNDSCAAALGLNSTVSAAIGGCIAAAYKDEGDRYRLLVGYPGEGGLVPLTKYRVVLQEGLPIWQVAND